MAAEQMSLEDIQRRMAKAVMQPITRNETMRLRNADGADMADEAAAFIKPNDRLTSFERLEIYNRQYWFRLFTAFEEDFPGLQAITGKKKFETLMRAYLEACPSTSFSLRNLGSKLHDWLRENPEHTAPNEKLALDMVRLEWVHIESFDAAELPPMPPEQLAMVGPGTTFRLQPHIQLLELAYPVDDLLISVRNEAGSSDASSNNATLFRKSKAVKQVAALPPQTIHLAVHRHNNSIYYKRLAPEEFGILLALSEGLTLEAAIERGCANSKLDANEAPALLQQIFTTWSALGGFCAA
jgi:Putative DNA-binding domain